MSKYFALTAVGLTMVLAGCGTSQAAKTVSSPTMKPVSTTSKAVTEIQTNKTAQIVQAGQTATFVLTATTANGSPASNVPVTFYVGPMVPLGPGVHTWYTSGSSAGTHYFSSYSKKTNRLGEASVTLAEQPAKSMEMLGVKIGGLSTFNPSTMKGSGLMDAWWTTSSTTPTAPVGDYVVVRPFATTISTGASETLTVTAMSPNGPIAGAHVSFTPKTRHSSSMNGSSSMSSTGGTSMMTNTQGQTTFKIPTKALSSSMGGLPVRVVVSQGMARVAGGMNADVITH